MHMEQLPAHRTHWQRRQVFHADPAGPAARGDNDEIRALESIADTYFDVRSGVLYGQRLGGPDEHSACDACPMNESSHQRIDANEAVRRRKQRGHGG
jgi:hypothetical protein